MEIRKGTERGIMWGFHSESDNRGMDETWIHLYNEERTDFLTVSIGIEEAIGIIENAFENSVDEGSVFMTRAADLCEELRELIKEVLRWQTSFIE